MTVSYRINCKRCGREIISKNRQPKLCSYCKKEVEKERIQRKAKQCPVCGKMFLPKSSRQKFCSQKCVAKNRTTSIVVYCEYCGKKITRTARQLENSKRHFCSYKCFLKDMRKNNGGKPLRVSKQMRETVLVATDNKCSICGKRPIPPDSLEIHHINGNPRDNRLENIIALCKSCHRRAHFMTLGYNKRDLFALARRIGYGKRK